MAWAGDQITVTTASTALSSLLATAGGTLSVMQCRQIDFRIDPSSSNTIYGGPIAVGATPSNARFALVAATTPSYTIGPTNAHAVGADEVYLISTTGTTLCFVSIIQ